MAKLYEKRKDFRQRLNASIISRTNVSGADYHAIILDHSNTGLSFKSHYDLKPETVVYIRPESCPQNYPGAWRVKVAVGNLKVRR